MAPKGHISLGHNTRALVGCAGQVVLDVLPPRIWLAAQRLRIVSSWSAIRTRSFDVPILSRWCVIQEQSGSSSYQRSLLYVNMDCFRILHTGFSRPQESREAQRLWLGLAPHRFFVKTAGERNTQKP